MIVLAAIQDLGAFDIFLSAVVIGGVIQLALGFANAGIVGYFFPNSVIKGMLSAIGIIIFIKQIPHALGLPAGYDGGLSGVFGSMTTGPIIITAIVHGHLGLMGTPLYEKDQSVPTHSRTFGRGVIGHRF